MKEAETKSGFSAANLGNKGHKRRSRWVGVWIALAIIVAVLVYLAFALRIFGCGRCL